MIPYFSVIQKRYTRRARRLATFGVVCAVAFVVAAFFIYWNDSTGPPSKWWKGADLLVTLGVLGISGLVAAVVVDIFKKMHSDAVERLDKEVDFLRRTRGAYVKLVTARDVIVAEDSDTTLQEQFRKVYEVRRELEDIQSDLTHASDTFADAERCRAAKISRWRMIGSIYVLFRLTDSLLADHEVTLRNVRASGTCPGLEKAQKEAEEAAQGKALAEPNEPGRYLTVSTFLNRGGSGLPREFDAPIENSKGAMRKYIYGPTDDTSPAGSMVGFVEILGDEGKEITRVQGIASVNLPSFNTAGHLHHQAFLAFSACRLDGSAEIFINGKQVGTVLSTGPTASTQMVCVPSHRLKDGNNTIQLKKVTDDFHLRSVYCFYHQES